MDGHGLSAASRCAVHSHLRAPPFPLDSIVYSACSAKGKVHMPILYNAESMLWLGSINPTRRKMYLVLKHTVLNAFCYTQVQNTFSV